MVSMINDRDGGPHTDPTNIPVLIFTAAARATTRPLKSLLSSSKHESATFEF